MISIIICSRNNSISESLITNINETIGIEYELVIVDNSKNTYSIFSAYNEGVNRARYPFLCFMHDDIIYHTENWGIKVIEHFNEKRIGCIGVVGGHYMPKLPCAWFHSHLCSGGGYISGTGNNQEEQTLFEERYLDYIKEENTIEVVVVDGLWFCIPKFLFNMVHFDTELYDGFHCYDLDICLQIRESGYKVLVIKNVLIEHKSGGKIDNQWIINTLTYFSKWEEKLPQTAGIFISRERRELTDLFVKDIFLLLKDKNQTVNYLEKQLFDVRNSKAYRLGKFLIKPLSKIRSLSQFR